MASIFDRLKNALADRFWQPNLLIMIL